MQDSTTKTPELAILIDYRHIADELGGGRTIAYKPFLAHACGGAVSGILLSQFWYYANMDSVQERDGWFYKSQMDITSETGLTRTETEGARKKLVSTGVLSEDLRGIPATLWYRVNKDRLFEILHLHLNPVTAAMGAGSAEVTERLIAIYKTNLKSLSQLGYKRAVKIGAKASMVEYEDIMRRDCGLCHICGQTIVQGPGQKKGDLQFDHVQALNTGGSHTAENIKVSHAGCNNDKSDSPLPLRVKKTSLRESRKLGVATRGDKRERVSPTISESLSENLKDDFQRAPDSSPAAIPENTNPEKSRPEAEFIAAVQKLREKDRRGSPPVWAQPGADEVKR